MNYRKKANITLAVVFFFFLVLAALEHFNPGYRGIRLLLFVSEASLVGGLADWFAVTAIFKKPLGWGWHTALIPRNRERVIEAVAAIVQTELLNMNVIRKKIAGVPYMERIAEKIERSGGAAFLTEKSAYFLGRWAQRQDPALWAEKLAGLIQDKGKQWDISHKITEIGGWAEKRGFVDKGLDLLAEGLLAKADEQETRREVMEFLQALKYEKEESSGSLFAMMMGLAEMADGLNFEDAADAVQLELKAALGRLKDHSDPLRLKLKQIILERGRELETDRGFHSRIERWKEDLLTETAFRDLIRAFVEECLRAAADPVKSPEANELYSLLYPLIDKYWFSLKNDAGLQMKLDSFLADAICKMIQNEHDLIGGIVKETLRAYTDRDLNQFVEDKAGNDLQWIRINGSMIGGIVGLILFLLLEFVYDPYIMPVLTAKIWFIK